MKRRSGKLESGADFSRSSPRHVDEPAAHRAYEAGIIIGVGAVVLMLAIGESVREDINRRITAMYFCKFCPRQLSSAFVAVPSVLHLRTALARSSPSFRRCS